MEKKPKLKLVGEDGNAFSILARARSAAWRAKWPAERIQAMLTDAMSSDYDHLLYVMMREFDVR